MESGGAGVSGILIRSRLVDACEGGAGKSCSGSKFQRSGGAVVRVWTMDRGISPGGLVVYKIQKR